MGSRYGNRVSRSTPSQKLISAAAAWEWTLCDPKQMGMVSWEEGRMGRGGMTDRGSGASSVGIRMANN
jgi:hypothetical protein